MAHAFPKRLRLRKRREFLSVQKSNKSRKIHGLSFLVMVAPRLKISALLENDERGRVGITVSRRVGNAVVRNRIKRWVREFVRLHPAWVPALTDIVVIAKPKAAELTSYQEVAIDLSRLERRFSQC